MQKGAASATLDERWKCGWLPECNAPCQKPCRNPNHLYRKCAAYGPHELKDCVHGKWGFYYSEGGHIRALEGIHEHNPSGCAVVYLLIYNQDKQQILFDLNKTTEYKLPSYRRLTYEPHDLHEVATRFLSALFSFNNKNVPLPSISHRFIFTDASVIYPVCIDNECASQILFKNGQKWFDRQDVERAMKSVTLIWVQKPDRDYGYEVKDRGSQLGHRSIFSLASLVLRWLFVKQGDESSTNSRSIFAVSSKVPSTAGSNQTITSGYASASSFGFGIDIDDEPVDHVDFDGFINK